ncbi:YegS/Rv2252/BmrU family lipid kinase [Elusimicrobium simillimum]|uniref:diacylglycerol/lipid kinase family protein n=1 Tax=Elusimicrobium simillimum TaxID=3143438 RepID=UPI003C70395A
MIFIINPNSGAKKDAKAFASLVQKYFPQAEIKFTERAGHATELAAAAAAAVEDSVIACGGDGTINEVAKGLYGTNTALGIIPRGSGNGFAREIGMNLNSERALKQLQTAKKIHSDMGRINGELFINVAGIGIEADIAHAFATHGKRGIWPYFKLGAKIVFSYKPKKVKVVTEGHEIEIAPLTLVFANGRQYGTNFKIAPKASLTDGLLDMVQVLDKNKFSLLLGLPSFFNSDFRPFNPTVVIRVKNTEVFTRGPVFYHVDGEPKQSTGDNIKVEILPASIWVLVCK